MFAVIKRFLGGLFGRKQIEPPAAPPHDPYAYATAPRRTGPNERGGAVAVLEPDDMEPTKATGEQKKYS
ncbi:MAG: hypothetical protein ABR501_02130 [Pyrinomonadaceae bacterium]